MPLRVHVDHVKTLVNRADVEVLQLAITKFLCQDMQGFVLVGVAFSVGLVEQKKRAETKLSWCDLRGVGQAVWWL
jgi:hypothetical protein